jgi:hypothetical protein
VHNNVSFVSSIILYYIILYYIIYKRIIIKIYDLVVRHVSACVGPLQVTVKRNEVLVCGPESTVQPKSSLRVTIIVTWWVARGRGQMSLQ